MLERGLIEEVILAALETGGDFAEIFLEDTYSTNLRMVNGRLENSTSGRDFGAGIRVFSGTKGVYAYTNEVARNNLLKVAKMVARAITGVPGEVTPLAERRVPNAHPIRFYPKDVPTRRKVEVMKRAYESAKRFDPLISQVVITFLDVDKKVMIANSEGLYTEDSRVRSRLMVESVATKGNEKQTGFLGPGSHQGFEFFESLDVEGIAREASRIAVTMVNADLCPSGIMPVVIDNGFGGVIFHEACGHGLEATSVAKGASVFAGKLGQKVASELVTAIDDGTIPNAWGSQNIDDEGIPTRRNVLIENGVLKGYLVDKLNARRMGMEPTGSARRQSYKFAPTSRMTNTFIAPGASTPEEIIGNTEYGLYAKYMGGGSVVPVTGAFNFAVVEGYLIRNGKIDKPVRGATLIGKGSEVLQKIDMVGSNLRLGQGMCGSVSGSVPANVGQPMIRVKELTVGGRKEG